MIDFISSHKRKIFLVTMTLVLGGGVLFYQSFGIPVMAIAPAVTLAFVAIGLMYLFCKINEDKEDILKDNLEDKYLKSQINPHFLFNSLHIINNMSSMGEEVSASDAILKLSKLLKFALYESENSYTSLENEAEFVQQYIALAKLHYPKNMDISFETSGDLKGKKIAPMILINFIENALKHSHSDNSSLAWVNIRLQAKEDKIRFSVTNSKPSIPSIQTHHGGIGLINVKRRLELLYPKEHKLAISEAATTYSISLTLDLEPQVAKSFATETLAMI